MNTLNSRRGFTLIEVLIALVILGVLGVAFTKLLTSQGRFFDQQTNMRTARSIARTSTNILLSDLRMVQDSGGVDSVALDGKAIRIIVPYQFGLVCATAGTVTTVSMLPADSAAVAQAVYGGFAWRNPTTGRYTVVTPSPPTMPLSSSNPALCTGAGSGQAQIRTVRMNGRTGSILDLQAPAPTGATTSATVFLWQKISYSFKPSTAYPGFIGLYRTAIGGATEEILAPFDTSARFKFYQAGEDSARTVPPNVALIRGVNLVLNSLSPKKTSDKNATNSASHIVTSVFFKNVRSY